MGRRGTCCVFVVSFLGFVGVVGFLLGMRIGEDMGCGDGGEVLKVATNQDHPLSEYTTRLPASL